MFSLRDIASDTGAQADWSWAKKPKPFAKDRNAASRAQAGLSEQRSAAYAEMFAPVSSNLRDAALSVYDPTAANEAAARGGRMFDQTAGALEREQRGMGVAPVAGQERRLNLRRALAEVDAANRQIDQADANRKFAQSQAVNEYGSRLSMAGQIYGSVADMEQNRKGQYRQAQAAHTSNMIGAAGAVASIAMLAI